MVSKKDEHILSIEDFGGFFSNLLISEKQICRTIPETSFGDRGIDPSFPDRSIMIDNICEGYTRVGGITKPVPSTFPYDYWRG